MAYKLTKAEYDALLLKPGYKGIELTYQLHRDTSSRFTLDDEQTLPSEQNLNMVNVSHARQLSESWSYRGRLLYNRRGGTTCANCHDPRGAGTLRNGVPANIAERIEAV